MVPRPPATGRHAVGVPARSARSPSGTCSRTRPACRTAAGPPRRSTRRPDVYMWYFADKDEPIGTMIERWRSCRSRRSRARSWVYGFNTDILGAVVEKASGMPLDRVLQDAHLRAAEDGRHVVLSSRRRSAVGSRRSTRQGRPAAIERAPDPGRGQGDYVDGPRKWFSGGAGLLSTATDYARFLQMLLNGGELDGVSAARARRPSS